MRVSYVLCYVALGVADIGRFLCSVTASFFMILEVVERGRVMIVLEEFLMSSMNLGVEEAE